MGRQSVLVVSVFFLLFSLTAADNSTGDSLSSKSNIDLHGFIHAADGGINNFKWCSNQPTGTYCEDWSASCHQITTTPNGQPYYAYFEINNVVSSSNQYDYNVLVYTTPPGGNQFTSFNANYKGNQNGGYRCQWLGYSGSSFTNPSGLWKDHINVFDHIYGTNDDYDASIIITCTSTSQCASGYACTAGQCTALPDLAVTGLSVSPQQPVAGLNAVFTAKVSNIGAAAVAGNQYFYDSFMVDSTDIADDLQQFTLNPGSQYSESAQAILPEANHTITFIADSRNNLQEVSKDNNRLSQTWTWIQQTPNITIQNVILNPSPLTGGQQATLSFTLSEASDIPIYKKTIASVYVDGQLYVSYSVFAIPKGGILIPNIVINEPAGSHTIEIIADANHDVSPTSNTYTLITQWSAPTPLIQSLLGLLPQYFTGDQISTVVKVSDGNNNPVTAASVSVLDSLGNSSSLLTDSNGQASYFTTASTHGVQNIQILSSKQAYSTVWQTYFFNVIDYNARINAVVHDFNNHPIPNALLYDGIQLRSSTDSNGMSSFTTSRGGHNIVAYCPDNTYCTSQATDVENTSFLDFTCSCNLGNLRIILKDSSGFPIENAQVIVDNQLRGYTGPFGTMFVPSLGYGSHDISLYLNVSNPNYAGIYEGSKTIFATQPTNTVTFVATLQNGGVSITAQEFGNSSTFKMQKVNASFLPILAAIEIGTLIQTAAVTYDVNQLCQCVYHDSNTHQFGILECVSTLQTCLSQRIGDQCIQRISAFDLATHECWQDSAFLTADVAIPMVPEGLGGRIALLGKDSIGRIIGSGGGLLEKGRGFWTYITDGLEKFAKYLDDFKLFEEGPTSAIFETTEWSRDSLRGYESIARVLSPEGKQALEKYIQDNGGEERAKLLFSGMDAINRRNFKNVNNLYGQILGNSEALAKSGSMNSGAKGGLKGALAAVEGITNSKYFSQIVDVNVRHPNSEFDAVLQNGDVIEFKDTDIITADDIRSQILDINDFYKRVKMDSFEGKITFSYKDINDVQINKISDGVGKLLGLTPEELAQKMIIEKT